MLRMLRITNLRLKRSQEGGVAYGCLGGRVDAVWAYVGQKKGASFS